MEQGRRENVESVEEGGPPPLQVLENEPFGTDAGASSDCPRVKFDLRRVAFGKEDPNRGRVREEHLGPEVGDSRELVGGEVQRLRVQQRFIQALPDSLLVVARMRSVRGDERPASLLRYEITGALELPIGRSDGVVVDSQRAGQVVRRRKQRAGGPGPALDMKPELIEQLNVDRQRSVPRDAERLRATRPLIPPRLRSAAGGYPPANGTISSRKEPSRQIASSYPPWRDAEARPFCA